MRKLKVNTKLTIRKVNRMDNIDKAGLTIGLLIILPAFLAIVKDVLINGANLI